MYTITDVKELHEWMVQHFSDFPLFQQVPENELVRILLLQLNNNFCGHDMHTYAGSGIVFSLLVLLLLVVFLSK